MENIKEGLEKKGVREPRRAEGTAEFATWLKYGDKTRSADSASATSSVDSTQALFVAIPFAFVWPLVVGGFALHPAAPVRDVQCAMVQCLLIVAVFVNWVVAMAQAQSVLTADVFNGPIVLYPPDFALVAEAKVLAAPRAYDCAWGSPRVESRLWSVVAPFGLVEIGGCVTGAARM